jgi:hypothetical protein
MEEKFDQWALVELYGHNRIVGKVKEASIGGCSFVRVDVPEIGDKKGFTRYFGNNAIYSISPLDKEIAMQLLSSCQPEPVKPYELVALQDTEITKQEGTVEIIPADGYEPF